MKAKANKLFEDAVVKLNEAKEELLRPEEDLVSYLICKNAQFAIENFLKGYLLQNGIDPGSSNTIDSLYKECITLDKNFEKIDLSNFECKLSHEIDSEYCNETLKVSSCINIAVNLDTFLRRENIIN